MTRSRELTSLVAGASLALLTLSGPVAVGCASTSDLLGRANEVAQHTGYEATLRPAERRLLAAIFGDGLDLEAMRIIYGSPTARGASRTVKNTVYFEEYLDLEDEAYRRSASFVVLLAHEATHVWQYQNVGARYMADALFSQGVGVAVHKDRGSAYRYDLREVERFADLNTEQQGKVVEEYVGVMLFGRKPTRAQSFEEAGEVAWLQRAQAILREGLNPALPPLLPADYRADFDGLR